MNKKNAHVIKVLEELGLRKSRPLTEDEEHLFTLATNEEEAFYEKILQLFEFEYVDIRQKMTPEHFAHLIKRIIPQDALKKGQKYHAEVSGDRNLLVITDVDTKEKKEYNLPKRGMLAQNLIDVVRNKNLNPFTAR